MFSNFWSTLISKRVDLLYVPYGHADKYLKDGYKIAPEEDNNRDLSSVWLEKREPIFKQKSGEK